MVEPNYNKELLHYIPDPSKREMRAGRIQGLENAVLRAVQKSVQPLMTVVAVEDADTYLSQKHEKEVVLNGQGEALQVYEHKERRYYRRSDLDKLEVNTPADELISWVFTLEDAPPLDGMPAQTLSKTAEEVVVPEEDAISGTKPEDLVRLHILSTLYQSFATRYNKSISFEEERGMRRVSTAWDGLSLMGRVIMIAAYVENKRSTEVREELEISVTEYKTLRKNAEDIVYETLTTGKVPDISETDLSIRRSKRAEMTKYEELIRDNHPFLESKSEELVRLDAIMETLSDAERHALAAYYGQHVPVVRIGMEIGIHYAAVRPVINNALEKIRVAFEGTREARDEEKPPQQRESARDTFKISDTLDVSCRDFYATLNEYRTNPERVKREENEEEAPVSPEEKRIAKFLPLDRQEIQISEVELLYFGLVSGRFILKRDDALIAKVGEAYALLSEKQKEIIELIYVKKYKGTRVQAALVITQPEYLTERRRAERILQEVMNGTYQRKEKEPSDDGKGEETEPAGKNTPLLERIVGKTFTKEQIDAARPYLSPMHIHIVDETLRYGTTREAIKACGVSKPTYYKYRNSAEAIIRAVAEGTYQPSPVRKRRERRKSDETRARQGKEEEEENHAPPPKRKRRLSSRGEKDDKPKAIARPKRKSDLQKRMEAYRLLHGEKATADPFKNEDDLDDEKYIPTLGKEKKELEEDEVIIDSSLEERSQKRYAKVKALLRQKRRLHDLSSHKEESELVAVIIGDSLIDFLVDSAAYPVAALYAELLYGRVRVPTGSRKISVWPLANKGLYTASEGAPSIERHFVSTYEAYAAQEKTPEALVALYKENLALLRGYVAVVGRYLSGRTEKPDWEYKPHWKIAWLELMEAYKKEEKAPLDLRATAFRDIVVDPTIKKAMREGYAAILHYGGRARNIIISQFSRFAKSRAKAYTGLPLDFMDAAQEASLGVFSATERFDYTREDKKTGKRVRFMTYAFYWANQKIQRTNDEMKGVPVYMLERVRTLDRVEESLRKELGEEPPKEHVLKVFMEKTGLNEEDVKKVIRTRTQLKVRSLDAATTDEDDSSLYNIIPDTSAGNPEKGNERIDLERRIKNAKLTGREKRVIELRYFNDMTLEETGEEFKLTRERIRQIEIKALKKLRNVTDVKKGVRQRASEDEKDMDEADAEEERAEKTRAPLRAPPDMIVGTSIPNSYAGQPYAATDPETQEITRRFTASSRDIIERYYMRGESLVTIRADTKQPLEHITRLLENAGKLLPK